VKASPPPKVGSSSFSLSGFGDTELSGPLVASNGLIYATSGNKLNGSVDGRVLSE